MTTPTYLPNTDSNADWATSVEIRLRSTTSTHAIYDTWNPANNAWWQPTDVHSIKVGTDPTASDYNIWSDNGTADPNSIVQSTINGLQYISLYNNATLNYVFLKPTSANASWLSTPPVETLVKTVDNTPSGSGTTSESFDPAAWLWYWYSVDNQSDDIVRVNIINIVSQQLTDFSAFVTDKVSGITSAIQGAVIANDPSNPSEYVVTINLPEQTIKDNIIFITDDTNNSNVIGEVDFEPASQVVVGSRRGSLNFW